MATDRIGDAVRHLRRSALWGAEASDGQLLRRYAAERDEAAFAALVRRHGPMVLGVCRRLLGHGPDAEDAFQATFLVLARRAAGLTRPEQVGGFLHGVARRTALEARAAAARRNAKERQVGALPEHAAPADRPAPDWLPLLDEELGRLPDRLRVPVVLCDLEGRSRKETARLLGLPEGTLSSRLADARARLARRLSRRGVALSLTALAALGRAASAVVPAASVRQAAQAATAGAVPASVAALTERVIKAMLFAKLKTAAAWLFAAALVVAGLTPGPSPAPAAPPEGARPPRQQVAFLDEKKPPADAPPSGRIFYHQNASLATVAPDGTAPKDVARFGGDAVTVQGHLTRVAPDGGRVAYGCSIWEGNGVTSPDSIHLRELGGKGKKDELLVRMPGAELHGWCWSPDAAKVAFVSWKEGEGYRNWVVDVKSKKVEEVKLPPVKWQKGGESPPSIQEWAPDGKGFLVMGDGLHLVNADGTGMRRLTPAGLHYFHGRAWLAPDGKNLLYVVVNADRSHTLFVVPTAGGKPRALVEGLNFYSLDARWSPDGRHVVYAATLMGEKGERGEETSLNVVDVEGKKTALLTTVKHGAGIVGITLTGWR